MMAPLLEMGSVALNTGKQLAVLIARGHQYSEACSEDEPGFALIIFTFPPS